MVPLAIQEMREASRADVHELVEYRGNNGLVHDLKVKACFARES